MKRVKYNWSHLFVSIWKLIFKNLLVIILAILLFGCDKGRDITENTDDPIIKDSLIELEEFVVMSFNLRNEVESDPQTLDERKWNICKVILDNNPDVLGVQEIAADWMSDWLSSKLDSAGYDKYLSSGQFGSPKIIYYKRSRFARENQGTFQMQFTDNRAGTWVILFDKLNNRRYFFSNSHWTTVSSEERVATAKIILDVITKNSHGLPLIVFGDFNAKPGTPEITTIKDVNRFNLVCTHGEKGDTFHGWDSSGDKKIDWILCSRDFTVKASSVIISSYNGFYPSDHWPITASIVPAY